MRLEGLHWPEHQSKRLRSESPQPGKRENDAGEQPSNHDNPQTEDDLNSLILNLWLVIVNH